MDIEAMQLLIDSGGDPKTMLAIAEGYLEGAVLRDTVAAEAWLMRAVEAEDPLESPRAMAMLASRILGKEEVFPDSEYLSLRRRAETAVGQERISLLALLELGSDRQKKLD